jgi:putative RNA 2'-phosphotransferase
MLSKEQTTKISRALSYVLRHNPSSINLQVDKNGWASVKDLLSKLKVNGTTISYDVLKYIVETNNKKRFRLNEDFSMIRASQGHSIEIDLNYMEKVPPAILYYGTAEKDLTAILQTGLQKMNRHHVHLSSDIETAMTVGRRHGKPIVLLIAAQEMHQQGFIFFESDNNVWLTEVVPARFIKPT